MPRAVRSKRQAGRLGEVGAAVGHHPDLAGRLLVARPRRPSRTASFTETHQISSTPAAFSAAASST